MKAIWSIRHLSKNSQRTYSKYLKRLYKEVNLDEPISVEKYILSTEWKNSTKNNFLIAYNHYCKANGIQWDRPFLKNEKYPVKVPTEEKINLIISNATTHYSTIFHISKMGLRPDEISKITLRDIDIERRELVVRTSKLGLARTLRLSREVNDLVKEYVANNNISEVSERIFPDSKTIKNAWRKYRKRAFENFKDTELLKIRLYDLRHWFGTTQYIKTRDIFHVKYLMGHRNIESTLHYMHIAKGMLDYSDEYHVKVASTLLEFTELIEKGFEFITDYDGSKILRKRK